MFVLLKQFTRLSYRHPVTWDIIGLFVQFVLDFGMVASGPSMSRSANASEEGLFKPSLRLES